MTIFEEWQQQVKKGESFHAVQTMVNELNDGYLSLLVASLVDGVEIPRAVQETLIAEIKRAGSNSMAAANECCEFFFEHNDKVKGGEDE